MTSPDQKYLTLRTSSDDYHTSYLELADHPHESIPCVHRTVQLHHVIEPFAGPMINMDFDENNQPIGIEILYSCRDVDGA